MLDKNSLPTWIREGDQIQTYGSGQPGQAPSANSGLSGSSLIDANAVPGWLRSIDNQQQTNVQSMGNMRPSSGPTHHIENTPVPSRPRGEIVPQEQSEVAANVFSSLLGVSSSTPSFLPPGAGSQQQVPAQEATFPSQGFQNGQPQPVAGMQWNAPAQPPGTTGGGNVNYTGIPQQPQQLPNGPRMSVASQQSNTNVSHSKPVKRGILETIRSWFK